MTGEGTHAAVAGLEGGLEDLAIRDLGTQGQRLGGPPDLDALVDFLKTSPSPIPAARVEWVE